MEGLEVKVDVRQSHRAAEELAGDKKQEHEQQYVGRDEDNALHKVQAVEQARTRLHLDKRRPDRDPLLHAGEFKLARRGEQQGCRDD